MSHGRSPPVPDGRTSALGQRHLQNDSEVGMFSTNSNRKDASRADLSPQEMRTLVYGEGGDLRRQRGRAGWRGERAGGKCVGETLAVSSRIRAEERDRSGNGCRSSERWRLLERAEDGGGPRGRPARARRGGSRRSASGDLGGGGSSPRRTPGPGADAWQKLAEAASEDAAPRWAKTPVAGRAPAGVSGGRSPWEPGREALVARECPPLTEPSIAPAGGRRARSGSCPTGRLGADGR